jgi:BlaI family penicillinase repressor
VTKQQQMKLTRFELEIMDSLWELGRASVREIQEQLPARKRPAYTTVQTMIYRLEEKGAVRRVKKIGNAHVFEPLVTRKAAHHRLITELLDFFGGSARPLMAHLAETGKLSLEDIREMESLISEQEGGPSKASTAKSASTKASKKR